MPIHYAVADTQGAIGFMFQNAMVNALSGAASTSRWSRSSRRPSSSVRDPAFAKPDKPVGSFMTEEVARHLAAGARLDGHAGRQPRLAAHDRVAAAFARDRGADHRAPRARRRDRHRAAAAAASPSRRSDDGELRGVEAVIDKDRAAALLAIEMQADLLMIPTGVERVAIRFGKPGRSAGSTA